jgi:UDP-glucose 4-epimerase
MNPSRVTSLAGTILVTGGLGFIGGHLVDRLVADGVENIRILDNSRRAVTSTEHWPSHKVKLIRGDIRNIADVREAMAGCQLVYHLAAQSNVFGAVNDPDYSCATNVGGTLNVLVAARDYGVNRVVFTSSREVYGDPKRLPVPEAANLHPKNLYGASKAAGEMYCRAFANESFQVAVLRLANVYGPRDQDRVIPLFVNAAIQGEPLKIYGGDQVLDFIWIDMVVTTLLRVGLGSYVSGPLNVGSGIGTTILALARRVLDLIPSRSGYVQLPSRCTEVKKFVADLSQAEKLLDMKSLDDPLTHLAQTILSIQNGAALLKG